MSRSDYSIEYVKRARPAAPDVEPSACGPLVFVFRQETGRSGGPCRMVGAHIMPALTQLL